MHATAFTATAPAPQLPVGALESEVRYYSRIFPARIRSAEGAILRDVDGREWVDFFAGAGALNYGHNHPQMKAGVIAYLEGNGIVRVASLRSDGPASWVRRSVSRTPRSMERIC
jgi:diaminobutyrate-2-oxoglutarate transaminase